MSKRGLQGTSVTAASLIVLGVSWTVIALTMLVDRPGEISMRAVAFYGGLGLIVPGISRWSVLRSVDALGPSIAIPIQQGLRPLLAVIGALLLLGESVGPLRAIGIVAIVFGGWQLSKRPRDNGSGIDVRRRGGARRLALRSGILFPFIAAVSYATSDLLVRMTLVDDLAEPGFAAMVSTGSGLAVWLIAVAAIPRVRSGLRFGRSAWWLVLSGALIGVAILGVYQALRRGEVSLVTPINSTQPLIVLVLSALFLRDVERIRPMTVVAASAVVCGAILVSV